MADSFYVGMVATLKAEFVSSGGVLADPSAITLTITAPDGSTQVVNIGALTHVSTGVYTYNTTLTQAGTWTHEWDGTGAVPADAVGYLTVVAVGGNQIRTGPCSDWCSIDDVRGLDTYSDTTKLPTPLVMQMIPVASEWLYERTARRYSGICNATVRPCRRSTSSGFNGSSIPASWSWTGSVGGWLSQWGMCGCDQHSVRSCSCSWLSELTLGYYPVQQITEVRIDGAVLPSANYRLDDHRWLVRLDGQGWPCCQDLTAAPSAVNTFQVKVLYGTAPPQGGTLAAAVLAGELALSASHQECRLPKRLQTLTRQGVTMAILDPMTMMKDGLFGIPEIDWFVQGSNPHGLQRRASVLSPDAGSSVRRVGI